jgi:hypothetical protein
VKARGLFVVLHDLAYIDELKIQSVHVHIFAFGFFHAKLRLFERGHENCVAIIFNCVPRIVGY